MTKMMTASHRDHRSGELFGRAISSILLLVALCAGAAWGQVTASISGKVEDPSGASVPGATVTVKNVETGATRTVATDAAGNYRALSLAVGGYEVRAEKPGFKTAVRSGISLVVGQEAVVGLKLEVGEVVEEVSVSAEAPLVNTTTATVSGLVGERQVKDLPLNGRSFDNLIVLNAGAISYTSNTGASLGGTGEGNFFTVSGRRPLENLFLLNGIEYTSSSKISVTPGGTSGQLLGIDAIREFNLVTDTYSAQYGKRAGGQVSIVTQSGTNQLHGSVFEFLRNSKLDARNFFDQGSIPAFRRNQFGGSLGGPIRKDKIFLFGNYEGFRQRLGISDLTIVPDENARRGLLPCVANGVPACSAGNPIGTPTIVPNLDTRMLPYTQFWPLPNGQNLGAGLALAFSNPKQKIREDFGTSRADYNLSAHDSLSGAYTIDDGDNLTPFQDPLFGTSVILRSHVFSLEETHIFSPAVINTARVGFSRAEFNLNTPNLVPIPSNLAFITGRPPVGALLVGTASATAASSITPAGGGNSTDNTDVRNLFTYQDQVQMVKGNHQISFGAWFQRIQSNADIASQKAGRASFASLATFLQGNLTQFSGVPNATPLSFRSLEGAWFVEDSVKVRPNLTVRLGLRHEFTNGYNEAHGRAANFVTDANGVLLTDTRVSTSTFTENNAKKLFSPRIGLAWDVFGNGKTAVRSGFGVYYTLLDDLDFHLSTIAPFNSLVSFNNVSLPSILPISRGIPNPPACNAQLKAANIPCSTFAPEGVQANAQTPATLEWNFGVEQELTRSMALRVAYVASHSVHNIINVDANTVPPQICASANGCISGGIGAARGTVPQGAQYIPVGTRPNPFLSNGFFWFTGGNASYNSLQVELTRRFAQGLTFRGSYTWSKNLDMGSGLSSSQAINQNQQVLNPFNPKMDYGLSALDVRNRLSANASYELPFGKGRRWLSGVSGAADKLLGGWQFNTIVTVQSGFPLTPQIGSNRSGDGNVRNPDRPDQNPSFTGKVLLGKINQWFDPHAYLLPTAGTYGNVGRGTLRAPALANTDISLFKATPLSERFSLQFRAEFFNIFNSANFGIPNPIVFQSSGAISTSAGLVTNTSTTSRQIQFGLKLIF